MKNIIKFSLLALWIGWSVPAEAKVTLPKFFSDNMVLQREMPISVWGNADKKETVTIEFNGTIKTIQAGKDGKWKIELPSMKYGGPFQMTIKGKDNTVTFDNILIGDVWLCSGQSNMEFTLNSAKGADEAIQKSENKQIRLLTVPKTIQTEECEDIQSGSWEECNPSTTPNFSAVAYFFGQALEEELDVPIGLIHSSWGGTDIETWTSWQAAMENPDYSSYKGKTLEKSLGYSMKDIERFKSSMQTDKGIKEKWFAPTYNTTSWKKTHVPALWEGSLKNEDGVIWYRTEVTLPESAGGLAGHIQLGPIDDEDITYINGTQVGSVNLWNANRDYRIATGILKSGKNVIAVRVKDNSGEGGFLASDDQAYLEVGGKKYPLAGEWSYKPSVLSSTFGFKGTGSGPNGFSSLLYNGMIHPLVGYGIKGVIWYQGENNAGRAYHYRQLFPLLINDWRNQWGYEFPFLWVQLASFMGEEAEPGGSNWAELREAQNMTLSLPKTGQAVITDIGEALDIHPRNKKDVGLRLAANALKIAYGKDILGSGPVYQSMAKEGNKIILSFTNTGKGLSTQDKSKYKYVKGFAIAGEDQKFVWAQAYIQNNKVVVFSDKVENPVAVRYGWANNPYDNNLVNSDGWLASPFRTDNWTGQTEGK